MCQMRKLWEEKIHEKKEKVVKKTWHGGKWGEVSPTILNNSVDEDQIERRGKRK